MEGRLGDNQEMKNLTIPVKAFDDLIKFSSNKTVGKVMKRIEICDDKEVMKAQIKELLYEQYRDLGDLIFALNYGLSVQEVYKKE